MYRLVTVAYFEVENLHLHYLIKAAAAPRVSISLHMSKTIPGLRLRWPHPTIIWRSTLGSAVKPLYESARCPTNALA